MQMYKWNPENYAKSSEAQLKWAKEVLSKLALQGNESVLDIGSGDGKITAEISTQLPARYILGIDSSEDMINYARAKYPREKFPNLDFKIMNAEDLNFKEEFDVIFSNATLHWIVDQVKVLQGIKKSLRPKGKTLLQMGGKGNAADMLAVVNKIIRDKKWHRYFEHFSFLYGFYGIDEYKRWVEEVGLTAKKIELIPKDMIQEGEEGLAAWIKTTWLPYTVQVPESLREEFVYEIVKTYIETYPIDSAGHAHVKMMRLEISAVNE